MADYAQACQDWWDAAEELMEAEERGKPIDDARLVTAWNAMCAHKIVDAADRRANLKMKVIDWAAAQKRRATGT